MNETDGTGPNNPKATKMNQEKGSERVTMEGSLVAHVDL